MKMNFIKVTQIIAVSIAFCSLSFGQVGINTENPHPKSAMDIKSPSGSNRGVLLPRMTQVQMDSISVSPGTEVGLMVFNTTDRLFYYYDGSEWIGLVPKQPSNSYVTNPVIKGNIVLDSGSVVATNTTVTDATINGNINVNGFAQNALVPTGAIMMWSGDPNALPAGWGLCNGHYYGPGGYDVVVLPPFFPIGIIHSPDLRGRFIVSYDDRLTDPGNGIWDPNYNIVEMTGGQKNVVLNASNLPPHQHSISTSGIDGGTVNVGFDGDHGHSFPMKDDDNNNDDDSGYPETGNAGGSDQTGYTNNAGNHNHTLNGTSGNGTSNGLNSSPVENRPPYYVLAYIIKLP